MLAQQGSQQLPTGAKRKPYSSRACQECQRRKTKCTEERPCPSCRSREVECRSAETETDQPATVKRPRLKARVTDTPVQSGRPTGPYQPTSFRDSDSDLLLKEIQRLRGDVYFLTRHNMTKETKEAPLQFPLVPLPTLDSMQQPSEFLYPMEDQIALSIDQDELTPDSCQTDTFNPSSLWASPDAIANKIGAIRGTTVTDSFLVNPASMSSNKTFALTLPAPVHLRRQIELFLVGFDDFCPYFRHSALRKRISAALHSLSYTECHTTIHIPWQHCTTFAILCNILSNAETVSASNSTMAPNTGHHWFLQGKRLMEQFDDVVGDSVEVVIYHMLAAGSMMEAEKLRPAALHLVRALQCAFSIGINDNTRWKQEPDDIVSRKCLFWVLYFTDKRIHYKCGIPYLLRPEDVNMDETLVAEGKSESEIEKLELVDGMISYTRLWTSAWSSFLAPKAQLAGKWSEVQIFDARIMIEYRSLPQRLLWETEKVQEYLHHGTTESGMRRKLQVFLWHESLRLIIRQARVSSPTGDMERQHSSFSICKATVSAIAAYMKNFVCMRPIGYFLTCSLVDCIFHIKQEPSSILDPTESQNIYGQITNLLETLSLSVGSAQRALAALRCVLIINSGCDYGLDLGDSSSILDPIRGGAEDAFTERGRVFPDGYSDEGIAETLNFLGLVP